jgi:hypothetical protein
MICVSRESALASNHHETMTTTTTSEFLTLWSVSTFPGSEWILERTLSRTYISEAFGLEEGERITGDDGRIWTAIQKGETPSN